jgi:23S rRNA pseudouridine2605 synthase
MRIQKYMAQCGVASRRKSEEIIAQGRVKVNDIMVTELGFKINPTKDVVKVDNKIIQMEKKKIYIALNKPEGYVTTVSDQFDRNKVLDLVKEINERVYPIGRLDYDTSGLLLLTNDGDLAYKLTHPKHEINKKYIAVVKGNPTEEDLDLFRVGLDIEGYVTAPALIRVMNCWEKKTTVEIQIHEGKNRQIRKMCEKIGYPVLSLKRIGIGELEIGNLRKGCWRFLDDEEIKYLKRM